MTGWAPKDRVFMCEVSHITEFIWSYNSDLTLARSQMVCKNQNFYVILIKLASREKIDAKRIEGLDIWVIVSIL